MFDTDRKSLISAYSPNATISLSINTLYARSLIGSKLNRNGVGQGNQGQRFDVWTQLPLRNMFRGSTTIAQRMNKLRSPMNEAELLLLWRNMPGTRHPLTDASKWNFDTWILDGEGLDTKVCVVVQGEFEERECTL